MAEFNYISSGKKINLVIREKISDYSCKVDVTVNDEVLAKNETASICQVFSKPQKLFLKFESVHGKTTMLCICDKANEDGTKRESVEENRKIADWIWRNIKNANFFDFTFAFTTESWINMEDGDDPTIEEKRKKIGFNNPRENKEPFYDLIRMLKVGAQLMIDYDEVICIKDGNVIIEENSNKVICPAESLDENVEKIKNILRERMCCDTLNSLNDFISEGGYILLNDNIFICEHSNSKCLIMHFSFDDELIFELK